MKTKFSTLPHFTYILNVYIARKISKIQKLILWKTYNGKIDKSTVCCF